jgi:hypothetical protein
VHSIADVVFRRIWPKLYEPRSLVLAAFSSIGNVPTAKMTVDTAPARTARFTRARRYE